MRVSRMQKRAPYCACFMILAISGSAGVQARAWDALYSFGDSYTDSGAGYLDGNGPTAVVYLAASLGIPFTYAGDPQSKGKSLNFAVSGAQTGAALGMRARPANVACGSHEAILGRGMRTQVLDFERQVKSGALRFDPRKTLFFLAGGLNDKTLPTATTIGNLEAEVRRLYGLGGRYFLIALLPTKIPAFSAVGLRLNPALEKIPAQLRSALPGAHVEVSHWGAYFDQVMDRPAEYGFVNTSDRCAGRALYGEDPTPCAAPNTYFYYHDGHPSTAVQRIVASRLKREVEALFPRGTG